MRLLVLLAAAVLAAGLLTTPLPSAPTTTTTPTTTARPAPAVPHHKKKKRSPARPPQFVVASFDGSGGARLWAYWRNVAKRAHAHFSFFVSGVYLVDWAHHERYVPPREPRGDSAIGFAPDAGWVAAMQRQLALGYR